MNPHKQHQTQQHLTIEITDLIHQINTQHTDTINAVIMSEVSAFLADNPESSFRAIQSAINRKQEHVRIAIQRLKEELYIKTKEGPGRSTLHSNLRDYAPPIKEGVSRDVGYTQNLSVSRVYPEKTL